ncbi:MAG: glycosyltransferase family 4 protein [Bacteroidota bacterium]
MNILYLCDEYPPGRHGGIGTSVRLLARQMVKMGHAVVVAGLYGPGYGGADEFVDEGVVVYRFRRGFDLKFLGNEASLSSRIGMRLLKDSRLLEQDIKKGLGAYKIKLEEIIHRYQIDIVEMPDYNDFIRFCGSYVPFPKLSVAVVIKMNGSITYFNSEAGKTTPQHVLKMEQTILNQAMAVAAVSKYTAVKSGDYLSYSKSIEIIHNGITTDIPAIDGIKNPLQVVFTGTLAAKKGIYQLANAWNIVYKQIPGARLLILGKGSQRKVIDQLDKGAVESVIFKGHVSTEELYSCLQGSAVSVFPSYAEAFALAPLEAIACGTAVVNSNRTSGPELIEHEVDGLLIDPDDIEQLANAIIRLLTDADFRETLAKNGNAKVKRQFDIDKTAADNIRWYQKVLGLT